MGHVGTKKSTLNSAKGLSFYGKDKFDVRLINALGEWNDVNEIKTLSFFKNLYSKQKNFHLLIDAFYQFNKINDNYKLYIIGEGEEKKIISKINQLKLEHKIILLGFKRNVYKYLKIQKLLFFHLFGKKWAL